MSHRRSAPSRSTCPSYHNFVSLPYFNLRFSDYSLFVSAHLIYGMDCVSSVFIVFLKVECMFIEECKKIRYTTYIKTPVIEKFLLYLNGKGEYLFYCCVA